MNFEIVDNNLYKDYNYLNDVIEATLEHENAKDAYLSVIFVDNEEIKRINKEYRNIDRETDVISFALEDEMDIEYDDFRLLGDIYISIDKAISQAEEYGHSLLREICFLATHGILHLLGYDHMKPEDEEKMFGLQNELLDGYDIKRE